MGDIDGYRALATAVVGMAVKDYARALKRLAKDPCGGSAMRTSTECERFFREDVKGYMLANVEGEAIIQAIKKRVERGVSIRRGNPDEKK